MSTFDKYGSLLEISLGVTGDFDFGNSKQLLTKRFYMVFNSTKKLLYSGNVTLKDKQTYHIEIYGNDDTILISNKYNRELMGIIQYKKLDFSNFKSIYKIRYKDPISIVAVKTEEKYRNKGLMSFVYQFLIDNKHSLVGDVKEYDNARRLWLSMNKLKKYRLDIIDIQNSLVLHENVKLEDIHDERVWDIIDPHQINSYLMNLSCWQKLFTRLIAYPIK